MLNYIVFIIATGGFYALLALSLNLIWGGAGMVNLGLVGFFALGAYASARLTLAGLPFAAGFAAAMAIAAVVALPLGLLAIRLRDDYLAIVTLGFSEIIRIVITSEEWLTGGVQGLRPLRKEKRVARNRFIFFAALLFLGLFGILWWFLRTRGR